MVKNHFVSRNHGQEDLKTILTDKPLTRKLKNQLHPETTLRFKRKRKQPSAIRIQEMKNSPPRYKITPNPI